MVYHDIQVSWWSPEAKRAPPWEVLECQRANGQRSPPAPGTLCLKSLGSLKPFPNEMKYNNDIYDIINIVHIHSSIMTFSIHLDWTRYMSSHIPAAARKEQDYSTIQESIGIANWSTRCHQSKCPLALLVLTRPETKSTWGNSQEL